MPRVFFVWKHLICDAQMWFYELIKGDDLLCYDQKLVHDNEIMTDDIKLWLRKLQITVVELGMTSIWVTLASWGVFSGVLLVFLSCSLLLVSLVRTLNEAWGSIEMRQAARIPSWCSQGIAVHTLQFSLIFCVCRTSDFLLKHLDHSDSDISNIHVHVDLEYLYAS